MSNSQNVKFPKSCSKYHHLIHYLCFRYLILYVYLIGHSSSQILLIDCQSWSFQVFQAYKTLTRLLPRFILIRTESKIDVLIAKSWLYLQVVTLEEKLVMKIRDLFQLSRFNYERSWHTFLPTQRSCHDQLYQEREDPASC